jgi:hypothetical protein
MMEEVLIGRSEATKYKLPPDFPTGGHGLMAPPGIYKQISENQVQERETGM